MRSLGDYIDSVKSKRRDDIRRFKELDNDLCMLCHAKGQDMRSFIVKAGYNMGEVIHEMIDLYEVEGDLKGRGWYLRTCKSCRGVIFIAMNAAVVECRKKQQWKVDSDGEIITKEIKIDRETGQ